jgi:hypothetical protein
MINGIGTVVGSHDRPSMLFTFEGKKETHGLRVLQVGIGA